MKPIKITPKQWDRLLAQLRLEYPPSALLIRDSMKRKLGFVNRNFKKWIENPKADYAWDSGHYEEHVMLDFFDERKRTLFILKYSEFINGVSK